MTRRWGDDERTTPIPFNRACTTGSELTNIQRAIDGGHISGGGPFTAECRSWLEAATGARTALLVTSCTDALEMAVILAEIGPGDEVIMPSYTFPSTATSVAMRGGIPVFVDVRPDTLNIDERLVEDAVTERTRAIMPVHYAGVGAEMDVLLDIARRHGLRVIEDAAQGIMATWRGRPLGAIGDLGAISFHETKNVSCGEGGALLVNDPELCERAEVILEKGTNRAQFFRGERPSYSWVDIGSSYVLSEINAAYLAAQLDAAEPMTARRLAIWQRYHDAFASLEHAGLVRRPIVPLHVKHNAHLFQLLLPDQHERDRVIAGLATDGVSAVFHYMPLHTSPAGRRLGRAHGELTHTIDVSSRLLRLPVWAGMSDAMVDRVIASVLAHAAPRMQAAA